MKIDFFLSRTGTGSNPAQDTCRCADGTHRLQSVAGHLAELLT